MIAGLTAILGVFDLYEKNNTLDGAKGFSLANILALVTGINSLVYWEPDAFPDEFL